MYKKYNIVNLSNNPKDNSKPLYDLMRYKLKCITLYIYHIRKIPVFSSL